MKVFAIALNTAREAIRNRILYSILFFALFVVAISAVFGAASIGRCVQRGMAGRLVLKFVA